jgi:hypothetical protein
MATYGTVSMLVFTGMMAGFGLVWVVDTICTTRMMRRVFDKLEEEPANDVNG